jgi:membrane protease YdiL (CAAX protease family)
MSVAVAQENQSCPISASDSPQNGMWTEVIAWTAILLASDLDSIVSQFAGVHLPAWIPLLRAILLGLTALVIQRIFPRPYLSRFIWTLAALVAGDWLVWRIESNLVWFQTVPRAQRMLGGVFLSFIPAALAALTIVGSGLSRRDLFLARGDMKAPTSLPFLRGLRWSVIAPALLLVISAVLLVQLSIVSHASRHFHPILLLLGSGAAVVFAALNAICEEFRFRCVLLAHGIRSVGVAQAVAATSVLFALAHFGGHPSGFSGMALAGFFAWVMARSMVDTRGLGWAWLFHFIQDVIIFLMVFMTGV